MPKYPVCVSFYDLKWIGSGIFLHFNYIKYLFVVYLIMLVFAGIPNLIIYSVQDHGSEWENTQGSTYQTETSIGNFGTDEDRYNSRDVHLSIMFSTITVITLYVLNFFYLSYVNNLVNKYDDEIKASDFAVMLQGLPLEKTQDEIKQFVQARVDGIEVKEVIKTYDISHFIDKHKKLAKLRKKGIKFINF